MKRSAGREMIKTTEKSFLALSFTGKSQMVGFWGRKTKCMDSKKRGIRRLTKLNKILPVEWSSRCGHSTRLYLA